MAFYTGGRVAFGTGTHPQNPIGCNSTSSCQRISLKDDEEGAYVTEHATVELLCLALILAGVRSIAVQAHPASRSGKYRT